MNAHGRRKKKRAAARKVKAAYEALAALEEAKKEAS